MFRRNLRFRAPSSVSRRRLLLERLEDRSLMAVVSHWTANNTAADSVGTNHGSLVSGATYAAGQIGQAFSFDGVDDRVQVADSDSLKLTNSLSIEGWVKATGLPTQHGMILFRGDNRGGLDPYWLSVESNGQLVFVVENGTESSGVSTTMPMNQFVHVAGTLDDATGALRVYLNGVLVSQTLTNVRPFRDLDPAYYPGIGIGNHGGYPNTPHNFPFSGLIDELTVYDHSLTGEEVLGHFNSGKGALQPTLSISDTTVIEGQPAVSYRGNFADAGKGLDSPYALIYGPDGHLYVSNRANASILRYDGISGLPLPAPGKSGAEFVSPGAAGLGYVREIAFGPDGNLYAVSELTHSVLRFDGTSGEPVGDGQFVASGSGGLDAPRGLLFHSDGYLYVTSVGNSGPGPGQDAILRYSAVTGEPAGLSGEPGDAVFIPTGIGGLDNPSQIVFHSGDFYVSSTSPSTSNSVLRFGADGAFKGQFVSTGSGGLSGPVDLEFHGGYLYVTSWSNNQVLRYNGATGAFVDQLVVGNGLARPFGLLFDSSGDMLVASGDSDEIRRYGESTDAVFTVTLSAPFPTTLTVDYATAPGSASAGADFTTTIGSLTFQPGVISQSVRVPIIEDALDESPEAFLVNLSNPVGGMIADGQGVGTIYEYATKFFVVNDAATDRTFEYSAGGNAVENYALGSGNTAPRGAASTVTGDKVWVVDANKNVYVYSDRGGLLGSWSAGGAIGSTQFEGITTNGTDVWILDNKTDKIVKYAGAASRTSGSNGWASNFDLDRGNRNAKDLVTDGVHFWVLEDGSQDKVFKYTLAGALVGSWTISTTGISPPPTSPTGITLDPANPNHLWIVDSGTDRVYQYDNAVGKTSGSQTASTSFALAAGNTNPQGIADPPVGGEIALADDLSHVALPGLDARLLAANQREMTSQAVDRILAGGEELQWIRPLPTHVPLAGIAATPGIGDHDADSLLTRRTSSRQMATEDVDETLTEWTLDVGPTGG